MRHIWILLITLGMTACTTNDSTGGNGNGSGNGSDNGSGNGSGSGSGHGVLGTQGASCHEQTDCAFNYSCIDIQAGDPQVCARDCSASIDCDLDYHCCGLANVPKNVCVPINVDNGNCVE